MVLGGERYHHGAHAVGDSLMGYRSEVCGVLGVDNHDPEKFKELIGKIKLVGEDFLNELGDREVGWKDGVFIFHADNWKWCDYMSSSAVIAWDAIWSMAAGMEGVSGIFIRLGEELDDNVVEYIGEDAYKLEDYACISRSIVFDDSVLGTKTTEEIQA
jgi:hypothetical protein